MDGILKKLKKVKLTPYEITVGILCILLLLIVNGIFSAFRRFGWETLVNDPMMILRNFRLSTHKNDLILTFYILLIEIAVLQSQHFNKKTFMKGIEHGSADWGKPEEIEPYIEKVTYWYNGIVVTEKAYKEACADDYAKVREDYKQLQKKCKESGVKFPYKNFDQYRKKKLFIEKNEHGTRNNMILSATEYLSYSGKRNDGGPGKNNNVCVVGGSGTGKTRFFVKPNLMQMNTSFVVTDPKGTILNEVGWMLKKNGYKIKVLNLIHFEQSMKYNPFAYLKEENDVMRLVTTLIKNTSDPDKKGGDEFWTKAEELLYQALFGYLWKECLPAERHLPSVVRLLSLMEVREDDDQFKNVVDYLFEDVQTKFDQLKEHNPDLTEPFYLKSYKNYKLAAGKTAKSILISAAARLKNFNIQACADLVMEDQLRLHELGLQRQALFVIISDSDSTYNFIASMMYTQLFYSLMTMADNEYQGKLPVPVACFLDEFANIGQIPDFDQLIATIRSRRISATIILQAKSQLNSIYDKKTETIIGNCDTEVFLGGKEKETLKDISESLGKKTIDSYTTSTTYSQSDSQGQNYQIMGRELMTVDELKVMDPMKCIVQVRGIHPFKSDKYDIKNHPNYMQICDGQPGGAEWFDVKKDLIDEITEKEYRRKERLENMREIRHKRKREDHIKHFMNKKIVYSQEIPDIAIAEDVPPEAESPYEDEYYEEDSDMPESIPEYAEPEEI